MTVTTPEPPAPAATVPPTTPAAPAAPETDWKAEARKWEQRAKENSTAADKLAEIEEAAKTEAQRLADRATVAESRVAELEKREQITTWKDDVAKASSIPAAALAGSTLEEIQAHAETLKTLITEPGAKTAAIGPYVPPEGATPAGGLGGPAQAFAEYLTSQLGQ